jgi:hypothetical protein
LHTYTFESNWEYKVFTEVSSQYFHKEGDLSLPSKFSEDLYPNAVEEFNNSWDDETKEMISQFVFNEFNIPTEFDIKLTPENVVATFKTAQELTDEQVDALKGYLSGQYSDGVGEGLEQHECFEADYDYFEEEQSTKVSDYISFEEYVTDNLGEELPDPDDDRYNELEDEYYDAEVDDIEFKNTFYVNIWPDNFSIALV